MWIAVRQRFGLFEQRTRLSAGQADDGAQKCIEITRSINRHYYAISDVVSSLVVGSWGKRTANNTSTDIDIFYPISKVTFDRFAHHQWNGQSALLQDVKEALLVTYPQTDIGGDGQVVAVRFNAITVEVVPAFPLADGSFLIPDTHNGGSWNRSHPLAEIDALNFADASSNNNCRVLTRLMKIWRHHCNVPIKSFWLEILMQDFLRWSSWAREDYFYYDWLVRDFLQHLVSRANSIIEVPGTGELINVGDAWLSRAQSAYLRSIKACTFEHADLVSEAGDEWEGIFGQLIPRTI